MDTIRKTIYDIDLSKQLQRIFSGVLLAKNDKKANRMGANVYQDGQAVSLSGYTVKGYFVRRGTETLNLAGAIDGNTAYVDLDAKCYHKDGSYTLSVVLCKNGQEQTLVIYDGKIAETNTDTIVENENTLSLADIVQQEWVTNVLNAADTAMEQAGKAAASAVEAQKILNEAAEEAQAIADSIPPDYTEAVKKLDEKAPVIYADASGDLVHITDGAGMPVKSLKTNIASESGVDTLSATRTGRNLLYHTADKAEDVTLKNSSGADISRKGYLVELPAGAYVIKSEYKEGYTTGTYITGLIVDAGLQNHGKQSLRVVNGTAVGTFKFSLEPGEKLALYNSNTDQTVSQTKTTFGMANLYIFADDGNTESEEYNGETLTANLPETVTSGVYDWTNGVLTKADGSTVQLTPQQLETLKGTNNIWSDAGATEVTYAVDTKMYIDNLVTALVNGQKEE